MPLPQNRLSIIDQIGQRQPKPWETPMPSTGPYIPYPGTIAGTGGPVGVAKQAPGPAGPGQPGSSIEQYYQRMMELMPTRGQQTLGDVGSVLGSLASDQRTNRVVSGNFQQDYDRMLMDQEQARNNMGLQSQSDYDRLMLASLADKRDSESDALKKLRMGSYLQQGGSDYQPMTGTPALNYKNINIPSMPIAQISGIAPRAASAEERQAGGQMVTDMMSRLQQPAYQPTKFNPNYDYKPADPSKYSKPGIMEKIGSYGGTAAGLLGSIGSMAGKGAAIGSIFPGIGTGIGAGLGAAAGGIGKLLGKLF